MLLRYSLTLGAGQTFGQRVVKVMQDRIEIEQVTVCNS